MNAESLKRLKDFCDEYPESVALETGFTFDTSDLRALIEGYEAVRATLTPKPIEDAPRGGGPILAFVESGGLPVILHWGHVGRYTNTPKMWIGHELGALQDRDIAYYIPLTEVYDRAVSFRRAALSTTGDGP